jgi:hypothetical protein
MMCFGVVGVVVVVVMVVKRVSFFKQHVKFI